MNRLLRKTLCQGLALAVGMAVGAVGILLAPLVLGRPHAIVHRLAVPLLLSGVEPAALHPMLPRGTELHHDRAFPEGFIRYVVYLDVEGGELPVRPSTEKFWLAPESAFPIDAASLALLVQEAALSRDDLLAVLRSSTLAPDDLRLLQRCLPATGAEQGPCQ